MNDLHLNWYVLKVVAGQEKKVRSYIDAQLSSEKNLKESIQEILIPSEKVYEMRGGKKRVRDKNFFPGYILLYANLSDGEVGRMLSGIPGALGFLTIRGVSFTKDAVPLRASEAKRILGEVDKRNDSEENLAGSFVVGEWVRVIDGPFSGFEGSVQEVFEERKKLNVTVKIFGRSAPIELGYLQVEKLS